MKKLLSFLMIFWLASPLSALAAFGQYRTITVDHTKVPATATNFPVLVNGNYSYLATVANGGKVNSARGFDVGFYTSADCATGKMAWEQVGWTPATGNVEYYVNVSSLSSVSDTVFYMCYGDTSISTDQSATTTAWNSSFKAVYHLANNSTLSLLDSTSGGNTLSNVNTVTTASTPTGTGAHFVAASSQCLSSAVAPVNALPLTITGEFLSDSSAANNRIAGVYDNATNVTGGDISARTTGVLRMTVAAGVITDTATYTLNTWNYAGGRAVSTTDRDIKLNANAEAQNTTLAAYTTPVQTRIGCFQTNGAAALFWSGNLDEIRFSNVDRGVNWLTTENNAWATSTFYTVGSETSIGGTVQNYFPVLSLLSASFKLINGLLRF